MWICPECRSLYLEKAAKCVRDGMPLAEVKAHQTRARYPLLDKVIGDRYHLIGGLGQGGLGTVYLAKHLHLEQLVAVKFLDLETVGIDADANTKKEYQTDFMREARVATLLRHDSVVKVVDFGEFEKLPYLVMEYVPGPSLLGMITERGRFSISEAINIARQIADALGAFHERQLVHRDLKPANVIMDPRGNGQLTLVDLGLVKDISGPAGRASTHPMALRGTPGYLAPEQVPSWVLSGAGVEVSGEKKLVDARVDLYALGVIFYEMIAGVSPYPDGSNTSIIVYACTRPPLPLTGVEPRIELIPGLEDLIYDTMSADPKKRPQTAEEFMDRLDRISRGSATSASWPVMRAASPQASAPKPVTSRHRSMPSGTAFGYAVEKMDPTATAIYNSQAERTDALDIIDDDDPFATAVHDSFSGYEDATIEVGDDSFDGLLQELNNEGTAGFDSSFGGMATEGPISSAQTFEQPARRRANALNPSHGDVETYPSTGSDSPQLHKKKSNLMLLMVPMVVIIGLLGVLISQNMKDDNATAQPAVTQKPKKTQYRRRIANPTIESSEPKQTPPPTGTRTTNIPNQPPPQPPLKKAEEVAVPTSKTTPRSVARTENPPAQPSGTTNADGPASRLRTPQKVSRSTPTAKRTRSVRKGKAADLSSILQSGHTALGAGDCKTALKHYSMWMKRAGEKHPQYQTIKKRAKFCQSR